MEYRNKNNKLSLRGEMNMEILSRGKEYLMSPIRRMLSTKK